MHLTFLHSSFNMCSLLNAYDVALFSEVLIDACSMFGKFDDRFTIWRNSHGFKGNKN